MQVILLYTIITVCFLCKVAYSRRCSSVLSSLIIRFCVVNLNRAFVPQALGYKIFLRLLSDSSLGLALSKTVKLQLDY
jgi:hypothetical protein